MKLKNSLKLMLATFPILLFSQAFALTVAPIEARVPITGVYVPKGFDDNDRSEVLVEGYLPNLCHRFPSAKVNHEGQTINVEVTSLVGQGTSLICPQMVIPFNLTIPMGVMDKGNYRILINGKDLDVHRSMLTIEPTTSNAIDENIYMAVTDVVKNEEKGKIVLKGQNPSDCFEIGKVEFISNGIDTYSVLPILKQTHSFCPMKMTPFTVTAKVPQNIKKERVLLHVRSMNGNSINTLFKTNFSE